MESYATWLSKVIKVEEPTSVNSRSKVSVLTLNSKVVIVRNILGHSLVRILQMVLVD